MTHFKRLYSNAFVNLAELYKYHMHNNCQRYYREIMQHEPTSERKYLTTDEKQFLPMLILP